MTTNTEGMYARLTEQGLASDSYHPSEIARDLAARLDKATAALAQKDTTIKELEATVAGVSVALQNSINVMMTRGLHKEALAALDVLRMAGVPK